MKMLLTDIFDLLKLQPKPLEHYGKYALNITIPILLVISLAHGFFVPVDLWISINVNVVFYLITMFISFCMMVLFFKYWLGRKQKTFTWQTLFSVLVLASIVDLLSIPLEILALPEAVYWVLSIALFCYSLVIFVFAIARGAEVSFGYAIAGSLIAFIICVILAILIVFIFIALGFININLIA